LKKLKIALDLKKITNLKNLFASEDPIKIFLICFNGGLDTTFKDGMGRDLQRRTFNLCNKIENCKTKIVTLEDSEFELIENAFAKGRFKSIVRDVLVQFYDAIDEAKEDDSSDKPSKKK